jgi:hypothetical protein
VRPRTFELVRFRDLSGVSGTGVVAEGCVFTDGSVALRWRGNNPATAVWPDLESVLAVHGHQGATEVQWLEAERRPEAEPHVSSATRLTPRPRPTAATTSAAGEASFSGEPAFSGEPGFAMTPEGWVEPEGWSEPADEASQSEFDLEELLGGQHQVRPPSSIADPSGLPSAHARGWAGARHLR